MILSIIIPVFNEATQIRFCLLPLQALRESGHEVIVVDGGSDDNTVQLARDLSDRVMIVSRGRAHQMNQGASTAKGDVLVFLHADTYLPAGVDDYLCKLSANSWGHFDIKLSGRHCLFRVIETFINIRSRVTSMATGDQAIFMSRYIYDTVDGFPEILLMEDIEMSKKLKGVVKPICLKHKVTTSSRRWEQHGIVRTVLKMWWFRLCYFFGTDPEILFRRYE